MNRQGHRRRKLRNFLINPRYQLKLSIWVSLLGLVLILANSIVFYLYIRENYKILVDLSPMEIEVKAELYRELYNILFMLGGISFAFVILMALLGIVISHRTAGPMYQFKRVFSDIQNGDRSARIRLRPNDDFQDVALACNEMLDQLIK